MRILNSLPRLFAIAVALLAGGILFAGSAYMYLKLRDAKLFVLDNIARGVPPYPFEADGWEGRLSMYQNYQTGFAVGMIAGLLLIGGGLGLLYYQRRASPKCVDTAGGKQ